MAASLIDRFFEFYWADIWRRLESKFIPEPMSGCWLWLGTTDGKGYGRLNFCGGPVLAHRLSYEMHMGPIPEGLALDHLCRNPYCINPDHLEPVTIAENTRRGHVGEKNRQIKLSMTHCKRGHPLTGDNVKHIANQRVCLTCRLMRKRAYSASIPKKGPNYSGLSLGGTANGARQRAKTHCPHGHSYEGDNLKTDRATGYRSCKECHRARERVRQLAKRGVP